VTPTGPTFAVVAVTLLIAHNVADHWVQTSQQAKDKGLPGWPGRRACATHVLTYTLTTAAAVGLVWSLFDLQITWWGFAVGQLVSAVTHYWADRRFTLAWLCAVLGKSEFYDLGRPRKVVGVRITGIHGDETIRPYQSRKDREPIGWEVPWDNTTLGTGAYHLDQAWHWAFLGFAAIVTAVL
jgi:hypothetical protein